MSLKHLHSIDLIENVAKDVIGPGTYCVKPQRPWQAYSVGAFELASGWYTVEATTAGFPIEVALKDSSRYLEVELNASDTQPSFVRLAAGMYHISVTFGVRPGVYEISRACLRPLSFFDILSLLGLRLGKAITQGVSLSQLLHWSRLAIGTTKTFGIRAANAVQKVQEGNLTLYDKRLAAPFSGEPCVRDDGPCFFVETLGSRGLVGGIDPQNYGHYTLDPSDEADYVVVVGENDKLTPDCLQLFANFIRQNPDKEIILADKWINGKSTTHVAWDPLLYRSRLPTPYAYKSNREIPIQDWDSETKCGVLSLPVAMSTEDDEFLDFGDSFQTGRAPCSIIIPTRDRGDLLEACLSGLFENTNWPHEVIVVDNGSVEPETFVVFEKYRSIGLRVLRVDRPFNFSALCNAGAELARYGYLLFLNNDVVLSDGDWLKHLMQFAQMENVGAVGAKLLYADRRLQHGGVAMGLTQVCGHMWRGLPFKEQENILQLKFSSLRSAVTGACLCVQREKFNLVSGFDEVAFPVTLNDIDLCLKLNKRGWRSVFAAKAMAYHLEGESRGDDEDQEKRRRRLAELGNFVERWGLAAPDPWLGQAISRSSETGRLR